MIRSPVTLSGRSFRSYPIYYIYLYSIYGPGEGWGGGAVTKHFLQAWSGLFCACYHGNSSVTLW